MKTEEFLQKLKKVRKTSNGWMALCPSHDDNQPSLSIAVGEDKILLKCFAGCDVQKILLSLNIESKDLYFEPKPLGRNNNSCINKISAVYQYTDAAGVLLYENVRFEPKKFRAAIR